MCTNYRLPMVQIYVFIGFMAITMAAGPAAAMFDAYLLIDGVPGECQAKGHEDQIELISFSHGLAQSASMSSSTAGGATSGRVSFQDIVFTKKIDKATPILAQKCSDGSHIPSIVLKVYLAGERTENGSVLKVNLHEVIISSISLEVDEKGNPVEEITMNFGMIYWEYTMSNLDGRKGEATSGSWNLQKNASK